MPYHKGKLRTELGRDEGRVNHPYLDTKGILTVGTGWNLEANGIPDSVRSILDKEAGYAQLEPGTWLRQITLWPNDALDALLDIGISEAEHTLDRFFPEWHRLCDENNPLGSPGDVRSRALLNMAFNLGGNLRKFPHFLAACKAGDWGAAAMELDVQHSPQWRADVRDLPGKEGRVDRIMHMILTGTEPDATMDI